MGGFSLSVSSVTHSPAPIPEQSLGQSLLGEGAGGGAPGALTASTIPSPTEHYSLSHGALAPSPVPCPTGPSRPPPLPLPGRQPCTAVCPVSGVKPPCPRAVPPALSASLCPLSSGISWALAGLVAAQLNAPAHSFLGGLFWSRGNMLTERRDSEVTGVRD